MPDPGEILSRSAPPPTDSLRYGDQPEHVADLWVPTAPQPGAPLLVVIHGGFWRAAYDRVHVRPLCSALADAGYVVVSIEYRRTGMPGGGWPGTCDDVRRALTELPHLLPRTLPPTPSAVLLGHSAGGHLALWAASQVAFPDDRLTLGGVVSMAGVCDLVRADQLRLGADSGRDRGAVDAFLGDSPREVPERYRAADPMQLAVPAAPVVLLHGAQDTVVPPEISRRYAAYAAARLVELDGIEHFGPINPLSPAWPHLLTALAGFHHP